MATKHNSSRILSYAQEVLTLEAKAISACVEQLTESFTHAVELLLSLPKEGRVIVSGMGKAGLIGMKISATFASTGTRSFFLHPAEAIHGDLGRFAPGDIALLLSNSGETSEILKILGPIKRVGCPIISITASADSALAKYSDATIVTGKIKEAGPHALAPTTSTAVMLAIGDALAMTVIHLREFTKEEFALYHPGGDLGRKLTLVESVMRTGNEHPIVHQDASAKEALHAITVAEGRPGAASIVDSNGKLVGVFTDGNLRRLLES
ncbi:MAG: KpsF/GutQ family sugar-phosphate isomerase, partial [Bdellovibrionales bacterium]|nr:KpsF/GutQ family sugar-phosphate isomerase [Bdellovibrionales bacterium]